MLDSLPWSLARRVRTTRPSARAVAVLALGSMVAACAETPKEAADDGDTGASDTGDETTTDGGTDTQDDGCSPEDNAAPEPPAIVIPIVPADGVVDTEVDGFTLVTAPFVDLETDSVHAETEFEIWTTSEGELDTRVWSAVITEAPLVSATLADGVFDDPEATMLERWEDHAVRARHRDSDSLCPQWSEWGPALPFHNDDGSAALFDPTIVHEFHLTIPPESWGPIDAEAVPPGCVPFERNYYRGALRYGDEDFTVNVGIKSKGGCGSARHLDAKTAFRINLEWDDPEVEGCPDEQRLFGQKAITLNNLVQDPSYTRERLAYAFYRDLGVSTPRVAHARVFVNDEYWGVYLLVESITRRFLDRWYASEDGILYEGTYGCDLRSEHVPGIAGAECFDQQFQPDECDNPDFEPELDHSELLALTQAIEAMPPGEFYPAIDQHVNFEQFLHVWAVDGILNNWDGFPASANNYRIYFEPESERWNVIPSGLDQVFVWDDGFSPFFYGAVLPQRCLQEDDCRAAFAEVLQSTLASFDAFDFESERAATYALIAALIPGDPRAEWSPDDFEWHQDFLPDWIAGRPPVIEGYLNDAGF